MMGSCQFRGCYSRYYPGASQIQSGFEPGTDSTCAPAVLRAMSRNSAARASIYIASTWFAPSKDATHFTRCGANNSAPGLVLLRTSISSKIPALMILIPSFPPKLSPYLNNVVPVINENWCQLPRPVANILFAFCRLGAHDMKSDLNLPQSAQKQLVICLPVSAVLEISLGVPAVTLKLALGTTML